MESINLTIQSVNEDSGDKEIITENLEKSGVVTKENQLIGFVKPSTSAGVEGNGDDPEKKQKDDDIGNDINLDNVCCCCCRFECCPGCGCEESCDTEWCEKCCESCVSCNECCSDGCCSAVATFCELICGVCCCDSN